MSDRNNIFEVRNRIQMLQILRQSVISVNPFKPGNIIRWHIIPYEYLLIEENNPKSCTLFMSKTVYTMYFINVMKPFIILSQIYVIT